MGAWIEMIMNFDEMSSVEVSLPSWERGLKLLLIYKFHLLLLSLPSWERGLKCNKTAGGQGDGKVAPLVGAWIEIFDIIYHIVKFSSRSPRGSVD